MTDAELDKKLKSALASAPAAEYLEDFPRLVLARLRAAPPQNRPERRYVPRLTWSGGVALTCLLLVFAVGYWRGKAASACALLQNTKLVRETLALFPNQLCAIVQDEQGMHLVLSEKPDVPASAPLYVRICDGKHCSSLVTFSGQEIAVTGQKLTVLSDAQGGIIVVGDDFAWSSLGSTTTKSNLKIEAKNLGLAAL